MYGLTGDLRTSLRQVVPPAQEPITVLRTKDVLRLTGIRDDATVYGWMVAARQFFEDQTGRQALAAQWVYSLEGSPRSNVIELPKPPLLSVDAIQWIDGDGTTQTIDAASYSVVSSAVGSPSVVQDPFTGRGRVALPTGGFWPLVSPQADALTITFTAGYGTTPDDVPELIKTVLYDLTRYFWTRPDDQDLPLSTQTLIRMFSQSAMGIESMPRGWPSDQGVQWV